jgi:hypothetical protein
VRIASVPAGDTAFAGNNLDYGAQFGVTPGARYLKIDARFDNPFDGRTPDDYQNLGLSIGTGDQSDYLKLVLEAGPGGTAYMRVEVENDDVRDVSKSVNYTQNSAALSNVDADDTVSVSLVIDTQTGIVVPSWLFTSNAGPGVFSATGGWRSAVGRPPGSREGGGDVDEGGRHHDDEWARCGHPCDLHAGAALRGAVLRHLGVGGRRPYTAHDDRLRAAIDPSCDLEARERTGNSALAGSRAFL